jgi:curved DNA-binding protein CbpA
VSQELDQDYYDVLQISPAAEPDTIHRVYRFLAQRFHPDNGDTGNESRFREVIEAYSVLSDPEARAKYDVNYHHRRQDRLRLVAVASQTETDFEIEQRVRLTVLEALYTQRRTDPRNPGIFVLELEQMIGRSREHLEFTAWFLLEKNLIQRGDNSRLMITAEGAEYLEQHFKGTAERRLLREANVPA